jgi:hypothetical protein
VLNFVSLTVTVRGIAGPPGVYDAGKPVTVALPVPATPLWHEEQTLVVGEDALNEPAPPGNAETVGTCNCIPKMTRAAMRPQNKRRSGERKFFKV